MCKPEADNDASLLRDHEYRKDPSATWAEGPFGLAVAEPLEGWRHRFGITA